ncbi:response regulator [Acidicapsa ligni]|uniref:response regulator n=1 Tax=Acidicapsa ligni TaxID=542300 RepID=UPI0021DFF17E|nr:response regulator [Acidicapsa ligni]
MLISTRFKTIPLAQVPRTDLVYLFSKSSPLLLVVHDECTVADTRAAILEGWGFNVIKAYDWDTAIDLALSTSPDLLISDGILTGIDGVELGKAIREIAPRCKVLLFSAEFSSIDALSTWALASAAQASPASLPPNAEPSSHTSWLLKPVAPSLLFAHLEKLGLHPGPTRAA